MNRPMESIIIIVRSTVFTPSMAYACARTGSLILQMTLRDAERLGRQLCGQDVAIVAVGEGQEPVSALRAGAPQDALVGAVAAQRLAREVWCQGAGRLRSHGPGR